MAQQRYFTKHHRGGRSYKRIAAAAIVVIVIVAVAYTLIGGLPQGIGSPTTITVTKSPTIISINGTEMALSLNSSDSKAGTASVYLSQVPIMLNQLISVSLATGGSAKLNIGTKYANIELQPQTITNSSVSVLVTPLSPYLAVAPDTTGFATVNSSLAVQSQHYAPVGLSTTTIPPTSNQTSKGNSTKSASTTVTTTVASTSVTTTISSSNQTLIEINSTLKLSSYYSLIANYTVLYANAAANCNSQAYTNAYVSKHGAQPTGPSTYQNVTAVVPSSIYRRDVNDGAGLYSVLFNTTSTGSLLNNKVALNITMRPNQSSITHTALSGVFQGLNLTTMQSNYNTAVKDGAPCGIYIG
ncbi:MAG: hypothetical protein KGH98_04745 [Candidatus Micrarchaeota archaeon]|nr:hypothetical protein [Candidatus Micrarchaeota archaeon]